MLFQLFLWILSIYCAYKFLVLNFHVTLGFELLLYQWFKITNRTTSVVVKNIYYVIILFDLFYMAFTGVYNNLLLFFTHLGIMGLSVGVILGSGEAMGKYINSHAQKRPWD